MSEIPDAIVHIEYRRGHSEMTSINISEYKRRFRAAADEMQGRPVRIEPGTGDALSNERLAAIDCLRRHGIELGDEAILSWNAEAHTWDIR